MRSRSLDLTQLTDADILGHRGPKNEVDDFRPYHFLTEPEYSATGVVEDVATIFLTNRECPFRCLMCDLWKNTTDESVPPGAIPAQIRFALEQLAPASHVKLYNSGNFFDAKAILPEDMAEIADLVSDFRTVIVENHPALCNERCVEFADQCDGQLEIALGLETSNARVLETLNKRMTPEDFARACDFLIRNNIRIRTFILLRPPGVSESDGIEQAIESVRFAFDHGVDCCAVIPTRIGNGIMDRLQAHGQFASPSLTSLEVVIQETLGWNRGRVFADLWDAAQFGRCSTCAEQRVQRLQNMNLMQEVPPVVSCSDCGGMLPHD